MKLHDLLRDLALEAAKWDVDLPSEAIQICAAGLGALKQCTTKEEFMMTMLMATASLPAHRPVS